MTADLPLLVATVLLQASCLLALGLLAAAVLLARGPALQSTTLRATLVAMSLTPLTLLVPAVPLFHAFRLNYAPAFLADTPHALPTTLPPTVIPPSTLPPATAAPLTPIKEQSPSPPAALPHPPSARPTLPAILTIVWLLGTTFALGRLVIGLAHLRSLRKRSAPASDDILRTNARLALTLHVPPPPVLHTAAVTTPCLVGLLHPAILLPNAAGATPDVLLHELAHLRRHDCRWFFLARLIGAALWFNPLCILLARQLESTADQLCDDLVLSRETDRARYADLLLSLAERCRSPLPLSAGAVSRSSRLARRVQRILDTARPLALTTPRFARFAVACSALIALFLCALPSLAGDGPISPASAPAGKPLLFHGILLDFTTKKPIPFAHVTVYRIHDTPGGGPNALEKFAPPDHITADADGRYTVTVPPEQAADPTMQLATEASAPHYGATIWDGWGVNLIAHKNQEGDATFGLRVLLYPADEVTGNLKDWQGRPLPHVPVSLYSHSSAAVQAGYAGNMSEQDTETDADGRYRVWALRDGEDTTLTIRPKDWATIQLNIGKNRGDLGTTIADAGVTLTGTLLDSAGKGVPNADLYAYFAARFVPGDAFARRATTDKDGHFALGPLSIEPYKIEVATWRPDDGGGGSTISLRDLYTSLIITDPTKPLDIRPVPAVHVRMRNVDPDGKPAPSIGAVWAMGDFAGHSLSLPIQKDADGHLDFLAPQGTQNAHMELGLSGYGNTLLRYRIGPDGPIQNARSLNLGALTHDRDDITLIQTRSPRLFVHVQAPDSSIPPNITATARYKDPTISTEDLNGYDSWNYDRTPGRWTFERFIPGQEFSLTISAPHFQPAIQTLTMKEGERRDVTVTLQPVVK